MRFSMKKKLRESAIRARKRRLRESKDRSKDEVFENMVDDIAEELKNLTSSRVFDIAVDDERAHEGKEELLDSILSFIGSSVAARFEDEHDVRDVDGIEAANEAADRLGRKSLEDDFWEAFEEEKKDIKESRFRSRRGCIAEADEKEDAKKKFIQKVVDTYTPEAMDDEIEFLARNVIKPYLEEHNFPDLSEKKARAIIADHNAFEIDDEYHDEISAIGAHPEEIGKKVTDILFNEGDINDIVDIAWEFILRERKAKKKSGNVKESRSRRGRRIVEYKTSEEDLIEEVENTYADDMAVELYDILAYGFKRGSKGQYDKGAKDLALFKEQFKKNWVEKAKDVIRDNELEGKIDPEDMYENSIEAILDYKGESLDNIWQTANEIDEEGYTEVHESRSRKSRNIMKESRELRRMKLLAGMSKRV